MQQRVEASLLLLHCILPLVDYLQIVLGLLRRILFFKDGRYRSLRLFDKLPDSINLLRPTEVRSRRFMSLEINGVDITLLTKLIDAVLALCVLVAC